MNWQRIWPEAAAVSCPTCGVARGEQCHSVTGSGRPSAVPHSKRIHKGSALLRYKEVSTNGDAK